MRSGQTLSRDDLSGSSLPEAAPAFDASLSQDSLLMRQYLCNIFFGKHVMSRCASIIPQDGAIL
jgi:hypothetical protein